MTLAAALIAASAFGFVPGDGIKSIRLTLVPMSCSVAFVDEGIDYTATGFGEQSFDLYIEARAMVKDLSRPPTAETPISLCAAEAKRSCGPAGVKRVKVTTNPDSCEWECYPPGVNPTLPPTDPPPATGGNP